MYLYNDGYRQNKVPYYWNMFSDAAVINELLTR